MFRRLISPALFLPALAGVAPLHASLTYSCDATLTSNGACAYLNGTIAGLYTSTFSTFNSVNVNIYVQLGGSGLGESQYQVNGVSFSSYVSQFASLSTDATAVADVKALSGEPDESGDVFLTAAQEQALEFNTSGQQIGVEADGVTPCTLGTSGCYDGVITVNGGEPLYYRNGSGIPSTDYDFFTIAEHETDEILGTASCLTSVSSSGTVVPVYDGCSDSNGDGIAPTDMFRYSEPGQFAWISSIGIQNAYFSLDGGNTAINYYNNGDNGGDLGDWSYVPCAWVQTYAATAGCSLDITTDEGTPEIQLLNAVGFNLGDTPEPSTFVTLGSVLLLLCGVRYRANATEHLRNLLRSAFQELTSSKQNSHAF